jgi:hypothetical protein
MVFTPFFVKAMGPEAPPKAFHVIVTHLHEELQVGPIQGIYRRRNACAMVPIDFIDRPLKFFIGWSRIT